MSNLSAESILRTGQLLPLRKLFTFLQKKGFDIRPTSNGHFLVTHSVYKELSNNLNDGTSDLGYQRDCARLVIRAAALTASAQIKDSFAERTNQNIQSAYKNLPAHLTAEHDFENGWTVVRDRYLPQIGDTIPFSQAHLLENRIHNIIEPAVREAHKLLGRCRAEYDINVDFDAGTLSHPIYKMPAFKMAPYQAGEDPPKIFEDIADFIHRVQKEDEDRNLRLGLILAEDFVSVAAISYCGKRGERTNHLSVETPQGKTARISFQTASNRRAGSDIYSGRITEAELSRLEGIIENISRSNNRDPAAQLVA